MIDKVLSSTTKGDMVHDGMDNDQDAGVEDQPTNQLKEATQQVPEKEPEFLRTRATNVHGVRGQP
jgi:hypothetical protein